MPKQEQLKPTMMESKEINLLNYDIKQESNLFKNLEAEEIQEEIVQIFSLSEIGYAGILAQAKGQSKNEYIKDLKVEEKIKGVKELKSALTDKQIEAALQIKKEFDLSDDNFNKIAVEGLGKYLAEKKFSIPVISKNQDEPMEIFTNHWTAQLKQIVQDLQLDDKAIQEIKYKAWGNLLQKELEKGIIFDSVLEEIEQFNLPEEIYTQPAIKKEAIKRTIECISSESKSKYYLEMALKLKDKFKIDKEDMLAEEFQTELKTAVANSFMNWSNPEQGRELLQEFHLAEESFNEIALHIVENLFVEQLLQEMLEFINEFDIEEKLVKQIVKRTIPYHLHYHGSEFIFEAQKELDIPDKILLEADEQLVEDWDDDDDNNLIRYIKLFSDKRCSKFFPKSIEKIKERLLEKLLEDEDLADYFLENLENYYQEPWVEEYLIKAVTHKSVAKKFYQAVANKFGDKSESDNFPIWIDEGWVEKIHYEQTLPLFQEIGLNYEEFEDEKFQNGESLPRHDSVKHKIIRHLLKNESLADIVSQINVFKEESLFHKSNFQELLQFLTKDKNWLTAHKLLLIMEKIGYKIEDASLQELIAQKALEEKNKRDHPEVKRTTYWENKKPIKLNHEVILFYINQMLNREILMLEVQFKPARGKEEQEMSFRNEITLSNLKEEITKETKTFFEWIRQYLIKAIASELKHQDQLGDPAQHLSTPKPEQWLQKATEEEIRMFLYQAQERFLHLNWQHSYGGKPWFQIAEAAYDLWKKSSQKKEAEMAMEIDRVIDLEHNSGMVFDKDSLIQFNQNRERKILNDKAMAENIDELLKLFKKEISDKEPSSIRLLIKIENRINLWKKLKNAPVRAKSYD